MSHSTVESHREREDSKLLPEFCCLPAACLRARNGMARRCNLPVWTVAAMLLALALAALTSGQCPEGNFGPGCRHLCHCFNDSACNVTSGACDEECELGYSGPWCQRRNVALGTRWETTERHWRLSYSDRDLRRIADGDPNSCSHFRRFRENEASVVLFASLNLNQELYNIVLLRLSLLHPIEKDLVINVSSDNGLCTPIPLLHEDSFYKFLNTSCDAPAKKIFFEFPMLFFDLCEVEIYVCAEGFYGENCSQMCGNCRSGSCDQRTGECPQGCEDGYTGSQCKEACDQGLYGRNCSHVCGHCRLGKTCNFVDGACGDGCEPGFRGSRCEFQCPREKFGQDCSLPCPLCPEGLSCHHVTGACPHVAAARPPDRLGAGVGVGLAIFLALGGLGVGVAVWLTQKRGYSFKKRQAPASESAQQQQLYSALDPGTREAANLYEDVQGAYQNVPATQGREAQ